VSVEREARRLRTAFGAALLATAAVPASQACVAGRAEEAPRDASLPSADSSGSGDSGSTGSDDGADGPGCVTIVDLDSPVSDGPPDVQLCRLFLPCGWQSPPVLSGCAVLGAVDGGPLGCFLPEEAGCSGDAYSPPEGGAVTLSCYCDIFAAGGRRPRGMRVVQRCRGEGPLGAYLARMAAEEAASVHAFEQLGADLAGLHAPRELVVAAARSAREERTHARTMTSLARRRGAEPAFAITGERRSGDLESVACHNAVEGCVRETYGALLACFQSARAGEPDLRVAFARIAQEETRHAALAWAITRWAHARLPASGRRRVARARRQAVGDLRRDLAREPHRDLVRRAGLPRAEQAIALLGAIAAVR